MRKLARHLTFANVIACLALFIALGSASYAAFKLPKNSVGTKQVKDGAITAAKIRNGAVIGSKVNLASLGPVPFATKAGNAETARSAQSAQAAADAQALNGASADQIVQRSTLRCPTGSLLAAGVCFEEALHSELPVESAINVCAGADRRLPSVGEAFAFVKSYPKTQAEEFWTEVPSDEAAKWFYVFSFEEAAFMERRNFAGSTPFRCVTSPTN